MEATKYILEFFFGNFWHFCGLVIVLFFLCNIRLITFNSIKQEKEDHNDDNNDENKD